MEVMLQRNAASENYGGQAPKVESLAMFRRIAVAQFTWEASLNDPCRILIEGKDDKGTGEVQLKAAFHMPQRADFTEWLTIPIVANSASAIFR